MKFLRIKYNNYRCFRDLELSFSTDNAKNIVMIVASNGGGKTEMLFSFWWVLYDFDFSTLKGKENTAYSLNSALHHGLSVSKTDKTETCWVELCFEHEGLKYTMKRSETFTKDRHGISSTQSVELSYVNPNGESSIPITNPDYVENRLSQIIPKKILSGIIFDGERMKQLSSDDENSRTAVEGVIRHINNEQLFETCKGHFASIIHDINNRLRQLGKEGGGVSLDNLTTRIEKEEDSKKGLEEILATKKQVLLEVKEKLRYLSGELSRHHDSKIYEERRKELKRKQDIQRPKLDGDIDIFYKDLLNGYLLITDQLLKDVNESVIQDKTPLGLTVEAVDSILAMPNCICGHPLTAAEIEALTALRSKLPPVNINSTVLQMLHYANDGIDSTKETIKRSYKDVSEDEKVLNSLIKEIAEISEKITEGASETILKLEEDNKKAIFQETQLEKDIPDLENKIDEYTKKIAKLVEQRKQASKSKGEGERLTMKDGFLRKCQDALTAIDEYNKKVSLMLINQRINDCYSILSQDYIDGKRIYIIQFDKKDKYRMVTYSQKRYDEVYEQYESDGTLATYRSLRKSDDEIKELIIKDIKDSNSTGQGKISSLAFAKAILEYSREKRSEDSTELTRSYPFLIDSPFTELSDGNLSMSSQNIHTFADQIILLISNESLAGVSGFLAPYVSQRYELVGNAGENNSTLKA